MRILIVGRDGFIARSLRRRWEPLADVTALGRPQFDLAERTRAELHAAVAAVRPDAIVCAAGLKDVARCTADPTAATAVNALGLLKLPASVPTTLISTDYVFNGWSRQFWREPDPPAPGTAYGRSKLAGEGLLLTACERPLVVRTGGVYGRDGTLWRWLHGGPCLDCYDSAHNSPTFVGDLADFLWAALVRRQCGLIHFSCDERVSRLGFARRACTALGLTRELRPAEGPQPPELTLDCTRARALGYPVPSLEDGLRRLADER